MPILSNPKHERFAQELATGKSTTEAMKIAGLKDPRNSTRLTKNDDIAARVRELQGQAAARTEITIASLTEMYLRQYEAADRAGQPGPAIRATDSLAKLHGFFIDRQQTSNVVYSISDEPVAMEEWEREHSGPATH